MSDDKNLMNNKSCILKHWIQTIRQVKRWSRFTMRFYCKRISLILYKHRTRSYNVFIFFPERLLDV